MAVKGKAAEATSTGRKVYTDEQRQHVINYLKQGKTAGEIAKLTKMSIATIGNVKRANGLAKERGNKKSAKEKIIENNKEIARLQDVNRGLKQQLEDDLQALQSLINSL